MKKTTRLQELFCGPEPFSIVGAQGALMAQIVEHAGFECTYIGGSFTSSQVYGIPDMGLITRTEMVTNAAQMADAVSIPMIVDGDNGYAVRPMGIRRTIHQFIQAGVAGIHLEDQLPVTKRSGSESGKGIIPIDDAVAMYRAAVAAKNELDPDFVIIARCEARGVAGGTVEDVIERMQAYKAVGVDVLYAEFLEHRAECEQVRAGVEGPLMGTNHRIDPPLSLADLKEIGYAADFRPHEMSMASIRAVWEFAHDFRARGLPAEIEERTKQLRYPMPDYFELNGMVAGEQWEAEIRRQTAPQVLGSRQAITDEQGDR
jgi:2-methylisocitrate lyase-like PEP mutase family enzyme